MQTSDFFRSRIDALIDLRDPLAVLATRLPWDQIEAALAPMFAHKDRAGQTNADVDLFGPNMALAGAGRSNAGRPRLPIRLMASLLYLKHSFNPSDEELKAISCAAGYNLRWLLRAVARLGIGPVFLRLLQVALWAVRPKTGTYGAVGHRAAPTSARAGLRKDLLQPRGIGLAFA